MDRFLDIYYDSVVGFKVLGIEMYVDDRISIKDIHYMVEEDYYGDDSLTYTGHCGVVGTLVIDTHSNKDVLIHLDKDI